MIGALTPLSAVEHSAEVAKHAGVVVRTMRRLSNVRVRNVATIGGNLAHGDPHMDLPPVLMALDADIVVAGRAGERTLKVENLFAGYYETVLLSATKSSPNCAYRRRERGARPISNAPPAPRDWPALGVAASLEADGQAIRAPRVVVSAATEKAIRLKGAEAILSDASHRRCHAGAGRRCRGRRSRDDFRRARLRPLQARTPAGVRTPRGARGI